MAVYFFILHGRSPAQSFEVSGEQCVQNWNSLWRELPTNKSKASLGIVTLIVFEDLKLPGMKYSLEARATFANSFVALAFDRDLPPEAYEMLHSVAREIWDTTSVQDGESIGCFSSDASSTKCEAIARRSKFYMDYNTLLQTINKAIARGESATCTTSKDSGVN